MEENNIMENIVDILMEITQMQQDTLTNLAENGNLEAEKALYAVGPKVDDLNARLLALIHEATSDVPETIQ